MPTPSYQFVRIAQFALFWFVWLCPLICLPAWGPLQRHGFSVEWDLAIALLLGNAMTICIFGLAQRIENDRRRIADLERDLRRSLGQ